VWGTWRGKWHVTNLDPIIMLIPKRRSIFISSVHTVDGRFTAIIIDIRNSD